MVHLSSMFYSTGLLSCSPQLLEGRRCELSVTTGSWADTPQRILHILFHGECSKFVCRHHISHNTCLRFKFAHTKGWTWCKTSQLKPWPFSFLLIILNIMLIFRIYGSVPTSYFFQILSFYWHISYLFLQQNNLFSLYVYCKVFIILLFILLLFLGFPTVSV